MAIRKIISVPDPVLYQKAVKITKIDEETKELAKDLIDTLNNAIDPEGAGLAAPQIGILKRMIVVRRFYKDPMNPNNTVFENIVLINPKYVSKSRETELDWEACLSVPNRYGRVERAKKIKVNAQDVEGNDMRIKASGFFARVIQHEIDHLEGEIFTDKVVGKTISESELDELEPINEQRA